MRGLGNALVWLGLTVGVPCAIYTTTLIPDHEVSSTLLHDAENCANCIAPRGANPARPSLSPDPAIALRAFGANPILVFAVQANGCRTDTYSFLRPSPQRGATR